MVVRIRSLDGGATSALHVPSPAVVIAGALPIVTRAPWTPPPVSTSVIRPAIDRVWGCGPGPGPGPVGGEEESPHAATTVTVTAMMNRRMETCLSRDRGWLGIFSITRVSY